MPTGCCELTDRAFSEAEAQSELRAFRRRGATGQSRLIIEAIRSYGGRDMTLLDIGGGVGALYHTLLGDVVRRAIHVDASSAYLKTAREEAGRRGHAENIQFIHADFTYVAEALPRVDIVTLDRVVCCYPDYRSLLTSAASKSGRALALSYPRETWYVLLALAVTNFLQRLRGDPFRGFVHPVAEMDGLLQEGGLRRTSMKRLFVWEVAFYERTTA
jgi:magnesium-protoporphyrin O-methyltransferase